ncbi:MAG TPA: sulfotransferase [Allosphingosinicella sp.]|jgi:tetratricopeptide (TPR) repeat protein
MTGVEEAIGRALTLLRGGDLAGAGREAEAALRRDPDNGGLLRLQGYILQSQERHAEAADCYARVVVKDPNDWEIWNNLGNARRAAGDRDGAIAALAEARALRPDLAAIHYNLGVSLAEAGRLEDGALAFAEAARRAPDNPGPLLELGKALRHLGRHQDALAPLEAAAQLSPGAPDPRLERARALSGLGRFDESDAAYRSALNAQPGLAAAFLERGQLLERGNKLERLPALLAEAAGQGVAAADLSYLSALALERDGKVADALVAAQAAPEGDDPGRKAQLVGRLADRLGDAATAFAAYREMNRVASEGRDAAACDPAGYRDHVAALRDMMTPAYAAAWRPGGPGEGRPAPVFLVGFPRSGTTLLDTLLMGHPAIHVLEEEPLLQRAGEALGDFARLPALDEAETERLRALYFDALDVFDPQAKGKMIVDKLPLNLLGAPLIHRLFPDAKLIFAGRHPCDVVLSCFMQNFDLNDAMANFLDLGYAARLYDLVMSFWTRARDVLPLDVHEVRYEDVVADKEAALRGLVAFLGLDWDPAVLDHQKTAAARGPIITPSYAQVAQPIYTRAKGRWERYREQMAPVLPILAPWAVKMGYDA